MPDLSTRPPPGPKRVDLARLALRGPVKELGGGHHPAAEDAVASALAGLEGRLLSQIEDLKEELAERRDRPSQLHIVAPPLPAPERAHWTVKAGTVLAGVLTGAGALAGALAVLWGALHKDPTPELTRRVDACEKALSKNRDQWTMQRQYDLDTRKLWRGAFEQLDVRFPYAPGEVVDDPITILPAPLPEGHKVKQAARVQPSRPVPLPPPELPLVGPASDPTRLP